MQITSSAIDPQRSQLFLNGVPWKIVHTTIFGKLPHSLFQERGESLFEENLAEEAEAEECSEKLFLAVEASAARRWALRRLASSCLLSEQLDRKLAERGVSAQARQQVIDELSEQELIDDREWIALRIQQLQRRGWGPQRIKAKLAADGAKAESYQPPLEESFEEVDEVELIRRTLRVDPAMLSQKEKEKLCRKLYRRGFSFSAVRKVVNSCH